MALSLPEELNIGIDEVDEQHRTLYAQVNRLHDAMRAHDLDQVASTLDYLVEYAARHFAAEERLMIEAGYPGFPEHLGHHTGFRQDLARWRARFAKEGASPGLVVDLSSWLTGWLREHIRRVDAQMAEFLRSGGARPR